MTMSTTSKLRGKMAAMSSTAIVAAALAASSLPAAAVQPFAFDYQANYMGMQGNGRMTLASIGGNKWKYSLDVTSPLATLRQSTVFEDNGGQWRPLSGNDSTNVLTKKTNKVATYDWSRGVASWTGDVKPERAGPIKLQAGDLDALLVNLAVVRDVAAGKPMNYRMVDDGRVKPLSYTIVGKESIDIGGKSQQATKVVGTSGNKQTIAWIVEGMPVPARILQRNKGQDTIDLRMASAP
jgi:hypothetical protein